MKERKINLLIYAHYYPPDVASTGQLLKELAEGMREDFNITVICVVPSYSGIIEGDYKRKSYYKEIMNQINIVRVAVPSFDKKNKISRVKNIMVYFFRAIGATFRLGQMDYVFAISQPPILGGLLGVCGKWIKHAKFIYNIQDFNPEQILATGYSKNKILLNIMMVLDKFTCKRSDKVIVVGRDMIETLKRRFQSSKVCPAYAYINNWIDEEEIYPLERTHPKVIAFKKKYGLEGKFVIMYSGNLGLYYDLENIIKIIKTFGVGTRAANGEEVVFAFVGDGSIRSKLVDYKEKNQMDNLYFIPYQTKSELIYSLNAGDVHWCINAKGIKGVSVPSKLYGIMAVGRPIIGVLEKNSEAQLILKETGNGFCCEPKDYEGVKGILRNCLLYELNELNKLGYLGREKVIQSLTKSNSINKYTIEIKHCNGETKNG